MSLVRPTLVPGPMGMSAVTPCDERGYKAMSQRRLRILYITRDESRWVFRGHHNFRAELARACRVMFVHENGHIKDILARLPFEPDLIVFHMYMESHRVVPEIEGLSTVSVPKVAYTSDVHKDPAYQEDFVRTNAIKAVFCPYREHFRRYLGTLSDRFVWLPHSIDPNLYRDYRLPKSIDLLMIGKVGNVYPFRQQVLRNLGRHPGFVYHKHPGYRDVDSGEFHTYVGARYAQEINRAKVFLTCGSYWHVPVAKYFEAPACMTCLMAPGGADFADLGLVDGETFVECSIDDYEKKADYYLQNSDIRDRIARSGFRLVMENHTVRHRVEEFLTAISAFIP